MHRSHSALRDRRDTAADPHPPALASTAAVGPLATGSEIADRWTLAIYIILVSRSARKWCRGAEQLGRADRHGLTGVSCIDAMQDCHLHTRPSVGYCIQERTERMLVVQDALQRLEAEAYYAVYRALAASVMDWVRAGAAYPHGVCLQCRPCVVFHQPQRRCCASCEPSHGRSHR